MTHPNSRTRRRARDKRANPKRYRLTPHGRALLEQPAHTPAPIATCVSCGCTDERACPGGCTWRIVDYDTGRGICSNCTHTPQADAWLVNEIAAKNRQALAQMRAFNNALTLAGIHQVLTDKKP